jgi:solute carrier family 45, member 1/2/4
MPLMLRNVWTLSLAVFTTLMFSTFFIGNVLSVSVLPIFNHDRFSIKIGKATLMIALCGFCWAIACWVPFAIIMEVSIHFEWFAAKPRGLQYLKEIDVPMTNKSSASPVQARRVSDPSLSSRHHSFDQEEGQPLMGQRSIAEGSDIVPTDDLFRVERPLAGGTVLGIHNLAIVIPQFIVS